MILRERLQRHPAVDGYVGGTRSIAESATPMALAPSDGDRGHAQKTKTLHLLFSLLEIVN